MNPMRDIGQIAGAFVQGMGHFIQEQVTNDPENGKVTSASTHVSVVNMAKKME